MCCSYVYLLVYNVGFLVDTYIPCVYFICSYSIRLLYIFKTIASSLVVPLIYFYLLSALVHILINVVIFPFEFYTDFQR